MGIFWSRTTGAAAVAGMLLGLGTTVLYMMINSPGVREFFGASAGQNLWFGIQPLSAGVFGVPFGLVLTLLVSWITRPAPAMPVIRSEM